MKKIVDKVVPVNDKTGINVTGINGDTQLINSDIVAIDGKPVRKTHKPVKRKRPVESQRIATGMQGSSESDCDADLDLDSEGV